VTGSAPRRGRQRAPAPARSSRAPTRAEPRRPSPRRLAPPVALLLVAATAACTAEATTGSGGTGRPSPFADCATLTAAPSAANSSSTAPSPAAGSVGATPAGASSAGATPAGAGSAGTALAGATKAGAGSAGAADVPDLKLPCFTGGQQVALRSLRGPAVINLWASWCASCRTELPAMQRLADATAGRLHVIGVDSGDDRDAAAEFAADHKVTVPTLFDRDSKLSGALGRPAIPITVFIDATGKRRVYDQVPPDDAQLAALVRANTGVPVTP
jgi:thiol-disulfide isomerase/thioredoxin